MEVVQLKMPPPPPAVGLNHPNSRAMMAQSRTHRHSRNRETTPAVCHGPVAKISLVVFFLAYVSLGAYVFMLIESSAVQQSDALHSNTPPTEEIRNELSADVASGGGSDRDDQQMMMTRQVLDRLWDITENLNILYKENWTRLASDEMARFTQSMHLWMRNDCDKRLERNRQQQMLATTPTATLTTSQKWTYPAAFLYSLSVITTLGCHPMTPETSEGKLLTILYASFGIPLLLLYLSVVGSALSSLCHCCWPFVISSSHQSPPSGHQRHQSHKSSRFECQSQSANELFHHPVKSSTIKDDDCCQSIEASSTSSSTDSSMMPSCRCCSTGRMLRSSWPVPVFCLLLFTVYIISGTCIFSWMLPMPLMDALLLSFMLLTTMGIPDDDGRHQRHQQQSARLPMAIALYVIVGLTMCSFCFNLIYEWLVWRWSSSSRSAIVNSSDSHLSHKRPTPSINMIRP